EAERTLPRTGRRLLLLPSNHRWSLQRYRDPRRPGQPRRLLPSRGAGYRLLRRLQYDDVFCSYDTRVVDSQPQCLNYSVQVNAPRGKFGKDSHSYKSWVGSDTQSEEEQTQLATAEIRIGLFEQMFRLRQLACTQKH